MEQQVESEQGQFVKLLINVTTEQRVWLDQQSEITGITKAQIIRDLIEEVRREMAT